MGVFFVTFAAYVLYATVVYLTVVAGAASLCVIALGLVGLPPDATLDDFKSRVYASISKER